MIAEAESELKRFLVGIASGEYFAKKNRTIITNAKFLDALAAADQHMLVVKILKDAAASELTNTASLANALALCVKSDHLQLSHLAYQAFSDICVSSSILFNFMACVSFIANNKEPKAGIWGSGLRSALKKWYGNKDAKTLASILVSAKSGHKWTHRDILTLIHFKAASQENDAAIKWFVFGKAEARDQLDEHSKRLAAMVDEMKKCDDPARAAQLLPVLHTNPTDMPASLHQSPVVWCQFVRSLPVRELLSRLEYLTNSKALRTVLKPVITTQLADADEASVDPGHIFVALKNYEVREKLMRKQWAINNNKGLEAAKHGWKTSRGKPCAIVVAALHAFLERSLHALSRRSNNLNGSWLVILNWKRGNAGCRMAQSVPIAGAAAITALYCRHLGCSLTVVATGAGEINIPADATVDQAMAQFQQAKLEKKKASEALEWALALPMAEVHDMILMFHDGQPDDAVPDVLHGHREQLATTHTRLAVCSQQLWYVVDPFILPVSGFGASVPSVVAAFAQGLI